VIFALGRHIGSPAFLNDVAALQAWTTTVEVTNDKPIRAVYFILGALSLELLNSPDLVFGEVRWRFPPDFPTQRALVWPSVLRMKINPPVPRVAVAHLVPDKIIPVVYKPEEMPLASLEVVRETDFELLADMIASLTRESFEKGVYAPVGLFRVDLPPALPLHPIGVTVLYVYTDGRMCWLRLGTPEAEGLILEWEPEKFQQRLDLKTRGKLSDGDAIDLWLTCTMAGLWRDMRVAGETVLIRQRPGGGGPARSATSRVGEKPKHQAALVLPKQKIIFEGNGRTYEWSTSEERERMVRVAHAVRGHLRRLPEGWKRSAEAEQMAADFGVVLPEGHTFVRPHVTSGEALPDARPVIARGLNTLVSLLGQRKAQTSKNSPEA
jgi:hypothetical protein